MLLFRPVDRARLENSSVAMEHMAGDASEPSRRSLLQNCWTVRRRRTRLSRVRLVERQVALPLPLADGVMEVLPLRALEVDVRRVELGAEDIERQRVCRERVDCLGERPGQQLDAQLRYLLVALDVHVAIDRRPWVELALDAPEARRQHQRGAEIRVYRCVHRTRLHPRRLGRYPQHVRAVVTP